MGLENLAENERKLLQLGLKYVPTEAVNVSKLFADVERLKVKLFWKAYWSLKAPMER